MSLFPEMAKIVPEGVIGCAEIKHRTPDKFAIMREAIQGRMLSERPLATLFVNGGVMMSDGDEEHRSNSFVVYKAHGDVLIAGLGIGMVLVPILKKKEVRSVTVIEKYAEVTAPVAPHVGSPKLKIIVADIFDWKPPKGTRYDCIYFDIWPDICEDNLKEIALLHQRFKGYKTKSGWMGSWNHEYLKYKRGRR